MASAFRVLDFKSTFRGEDTVVANCPGGLMASVCPALGLAHPPVHTSSVLCPRLRAGPRRVHVPPGALGVAGPCLPGPLPLRGRCASLVSWVRTSPSPSLHDPVPGFRYARHLCQQSSQRDVSVVCGAGASGPQSLQLRPPHAGPQHAASVSRSPVTSCAPSRPPRTPDLGRLPPAHLPSPAPECVQGCGVERQQVRGRGAQCPWPPLLLRKEKARAS